MSCNICSPLQRFQRHWPRSLCRYKKSVLIYCVGLLQNRNASFTSSQPLSGLSTMLSMKSYVSVTGGTSVQCSKSSTSFHKLRDVWIVYNFMLAFSWMTTTSRFRKFNSQLLKKDVYLRDWSEGTEMHDEQLDFGTGFGCRKPAKSDHQEG